jgi:hypothetical protein
VTGKMSQLHVFCVTTLRASRPEDHRGIALVLHASFADLAGQTWGRVVGIALAVLSALAKFVGALRWEDGPMTSWTAEVEWHEDLGAGGHHRLLAIQRQDWGSFRWDSATGTMTAFVTMEAPDLSRALDAVLVLVRGLAGQQVTLNRITATDAYYESTLSGE